MKNTVPLIRRLPSLGAAEIHELTAVLIDCVEGGAPVGFMHPLTEERATAFWHYVALGVASEERVLLIAEDGQGICGCVQLALDVPENQPHRANVSKLLVHRRARQQGLGKALLCAAEETARTSGRTLLVLEAMTAGDAARLYERVGWVRVGDIPKHVLTPKGGLCSTTVYYRDLTPA